MHRSEHILPILLSSQVLVHLSCPAVISEEYTDEVLENHESYTEAQNPPANHTFADTENSLNNYTVNLEEQTYLEQLANESIISETKLL